MIQHGAQFDSATRHLKTSICWLAHGDKLWRIYDKLTAAELELLTLYLRQARISVIARAHCHSVILEIQRLA